MCNLLYNVPAFLCLNKDGEKTLYFNSDAKYYNFYIFHEIAHFILGHENDCPQNEMDADLLACILIAPIENLPTYIKTAKDLSSLCQIPIDKAEVYWGFIKRLQRKKQNIKLNILPFVLTTVFIICMLPTSVLAPNNRFNKEISSIKEDKTVYITRYGKKFHENHCIYIKNKTLIAEMTPNEAKDKGYAPCSKCIK